MTEPTTPEPLASVGLNLDDLDTDARAAIARLWRSHEELERDAERSLDIHHADGTTWWYDAPLPRRWHRCRAWTTSLKVDRCACGAIRMAGYRGWHDRNSRRKEARS